MFDQLKEVKYFKRKNRLRESDSAKYFKEIKILKSLQKEEYLRLRFFVSLLNGLLFSI